MNHDYEVTRKIWEAHVPVEILVDTISGTDRRSFYMMIPRCSYFPLQLQRVCILIPNFYSFLQILQYFANYDDCIALEQSKLTLDCSGKPIKTYLPVGVLYDMLKIEGNDFFSLTLRLVRF